MELKTYTNLWNVEKRLYKFYDINLPYPVSVKQVGIFIGTVIPWIFLMNILSIPFSPPWNAVWILPPFAIAWYANKPVAEGKTLIDFIGSQIVFFFSPRKYSDLKPEIEKTKPDETIQLSSKVWRRKVEE